MRDHEATRGLRRRGLRCGSATKPQALDELLVLLGLRGFQIVEVFAALVDELHQATTRGMVSLVRRKVTAQTVDALGQQRNLDFGRAGVPRTSTELLENPVLLLTG